jgi:RNA polymerase sigma-70 factor (ECF subfamily)
MERAGPTATRRRACGKRLLHAFDAARSDLFAALHLMLGSPDDAQDVVQDAFLKCWRARDQVGGVCNMRAWIFRIGLNAARDLRRNVWRQRSRPLLELEPFVERLGPSPADDLVHKEQLDRLRAALLALRPEEREVFLLRQNTDRTYEEIAQLRGAPVGTVKTQMRSALQKLRRVLQERERRRPVACIS